MKLDLVLRIYTEGDSNSIGVFWRKTIFFEKRHSLSIRRDRGLLAMIVRNRNDKRHAA